MRANAGDLQYLCNDRAKRRRTAARPDRCSRGMRLASARSVIARLRRRLAEYAADEPADRHFAERLEELLDQIESEFDGVARSRLLELTEDTLERHLELREHTQRARRNLERLRADRARLIEIVERLTVRPENEPLH
jgi:hypothetical protein